MKKTIAIALIFNLAAVSHSYAEPSAQELYLKIFNSINQIEENINKLSSEELNSFRNEGLIYLNELKEHYPDWEPSVVSLLERKLNASSNIFKKEEPSVSMINEESQAEPNITLKIELARLRSRVYFLESQNRSLNESLTLKQSALIRMEGEKEALLKQLEAEPEMKQIGSTQIEQGKKDFYSGNYTTAFAELQAAYQKDPKNPKTLFFLGLTLMKMGDYQSALDHLKASITESPSTPELYYYKGMALEAINKKSQAIEEFKNAYFLNENYYEVSVKLGLLLFEQKQYDQALKFFEKAIFLQPNQPLNHYNAGASLAKLKQYANAQKSFLTAIKIKPDYFLAVRSLGNIYLLQNNKEKGLSYLEQARKINDADPVLYNSLGNLYLEKGELQKAIQAFEKSISLNANNSLACNNLSIIYSQTGKYDLAIEWGKKAVALSPEFALAHYNLGSAGFRKKDFALAEKHLQIAVKLLNNKSPFYNKAYKLLKTSQSKKIVRLNF